MIGAAAMARIELGAGGGLMPGELIVCPTPIGNLDDLTPRVRDALVAADYIACEDTRRTGGLLDKLGIRPAPPLVSNHEGNEAARATELAQRIERGDAVALVSDAGMPAISDPGYKLIRRCIERDLDVTVLPGPSVVPVALVASGLPTDRWRFEGFLPKRSGEMERVLRSAETVVAFESPRRVGESLAALAAIAPDRPAAVCRELTKMHEEIARGSLAELARRFRGDVKGEIVLVIGPAASEDARPRRRLRRRRPAPPGPVRRPPARRRQRRRRPDRHPRQRPLPGADRPRAAPAERSGASMTYYVTTPIYYVNAEPHLGHAYSTMAADVLARHMRQRGEDVFFLTGTDEHGEPIETAAEREGISPQELADRNAEPSSSALMPIIDATNDFFIRTSDPRHKEKVAEIMQRVYDNGWVNKGTYEGWYCPRCADFKTERELGPGNTCPIHEIPLEKVREENWFFRLSAFQEPARSACTRSGPTSSSPTSAATRRSPSSRAGPRRRLALAADAEMGDAAALGPRAADVRLVRRAAQLRHRARLRPRGRGPDRALLAGRACT